jgi:integrase
MAKTLTALQVQNSKPARQGGVKVRAEYPDGGCKGLYLVVQPSGARSWAVRYRYAGQPRKLTLGNAIVLGAGEPDPGNGALTLAAARKAASDALHRVAQGFDPGAEKLAQQKEKATTIAESFQAVAEDCFKREAKKLRSAPRQLANLARLAFPVLGARPVASIRRSDIVRLLDSIEAENGPVMADAILSTISKVLNDHARRTDDFANPLVRGMRRSSTKERARDRILSDPEITAVWKATESKDPFALLCRFLLLTGARREEACRLPWSEIDGTVWTLPAARNKAKQALVRPLSKAAQAVLDSAARSTGSSYVFTTSGNYPLGSIYRRKAELDAACGVTGWTLHDLRRTARSLLARAGVPSEHAERCLGHVLPGIQSTYNRHSYESEMLVAYEKLATLIEHITNPQPNVVPLARA